MKKIKLLTSISSIAALSSVVGIVATSCNKNNESEPIPTTTNKVTYYDHEYELVEEIDPNLFCEFSTTITLPLKNGLELNFDKTKITNLVIKKINPKIKNIYNYFLNNYKNLKTVDLSGLSNVTYIGNCFLSNCENLTTVNFGEINIKVLPNDKESFATTNKNAACYKNGMNLIYADNENSDLLVWDNLIDYNSAESPYRNLKANFNGMLYDRNKIILENDIDTNYFCGSSVEETTVALIPLKNGFKLKNIDKSKITKLIFGSLKPSTSIGDCFVSGYKNLTDIIFPSSLNITKIGKYFLGVSWNLKSLDLSAFDSVRSVDEYFLFDSRSLTTVDVSPLNKIPVIPNYFINYCQSMDTITFPKKWDATSIGESFLGWCVNLKHVDLSCFTKVEIINKDFMDNDEKIENLDLSKLTSVVKICDAFLYRCSGLVNLDLSGMLTNPPASGTHIGKWFLTSCTGLRRVDLFDRVPDSTQIIGFMFDVPYDPPELCKLYARSDLVDAYKDGPRPWCDKVRSDQTFPRPTE